jgi:hypothetical protein
MKKKIMQVLKKIRNFIMRKNYIEFVDMKLKEKDTYMFLGRLYHDAGQFVMEGSFCYGKEDRLFSGSVEKHIADMKKLWKFVTLEPEWLSWKDILEFEQQMIQIRTLPQDTKLDRMYS